MEAVLRRTVRQLARGWPSEEVPWEEDEYQQLERAAVQRPPMEVPPRARRGLVAVLEGFSLHAGTWVHGNDSQGLERLVRYGARGPVAESRLTRLSDGRYRKREVHCGVPCMGRLEPDKLGRPLSAVPSAASTVSVLGR